MGAGKLFLYTLLTGGLYLVIYWIYAGKEVNAFLGKERMSGTKIAVLNALTCGMYGVYFGFVEGPAIIVEVQAHAGLPPKRPFMTAPFQFQMALNEVWNALP
jgi:hypothetical protein